MGDDQTDGPSWDDIAGWYDDLLVAGSGPHQMAVATIVDLLPPVTGQVVVDVACGTGLATRAVAAAGAARVVGLDLSPEMVARARAHPAPPGTDVTFAVDDAQVLARLDDASYDGATCQLGLMDIPDLDATLAAVARVLRPGGWFAFVIGHPCTLVPDAESTTAADGRPATTITGYFEERFWRSTNPHGVRRAGNHHRTLATYLNALAAAGFAIEVVVEPRATGDFAALQPLYGEVPMFLAARVRRA